MSSYLTAVPSELVSNGELWDEVDKYRTDEVDNRTEEINSYRIAPAILQFNSDIYYSHDLPAKFRDCVLQSYLATVCTTQPSSTTYNW
jgi:hypothetical protein